nr:hypothetical protein [Pandoravirus massiliensis]
MTTFFIVFDDVFAPLLLAPGRPVRMATPLSPTLLFFSLDQSSSIRARVPQDRLRAHLAQEPRTKTEEPKSIDMKAQYSAVGKRVLSRRDETREKKNPKGMTSCGAIDCFMGCAEDQPAWSLFADMPYEIAVLIVDRLRPRDVAAAAESGAVLAVAAREALAKRLASALAQAGIDQRDSAKHADTAAHYVALHNAIACDDPVTLVAVMRAGVVPSPDAQIPPIEFMAYWATSVTATFGVTGDGHVLGAPALDTACHVPCRVPGPDGIVPYELGDDLGASRVLAAPLPRHALPHTPLIKAIRCGSRRVVRALLAAGARPYPSVETLLACVIDRLVYGTVLVVRYRQGSTAGQSRFPLWEAPEHREVDGPGIIDDLLRAFARTPPPLDNLDVNPLSVLRGALGWAANAYRWDQVEEPSDGPLSRVTRALSSLIAAGYSPDERISFLPQSDALYGRSLVGGDRPASDHACDGYRDEARDARRRAVEITERHAATAAREDNIRHLFHIEQRAPVMIAPLGLSAILAAYDAIPRCDDNNNSH